MNDVECKNPKCKHFRAGALPSFGAGRKINGHDLIEISPEAFKGSFPSYCDVDDETQRNQYISDMEYEVLHGFVSQAPDRPDDKRVWWVPENWREMFDSGEEPSSEWAWDDDITEDQIKELNSWGWSSV